MQREHFKRFSQALTACAELYGKELSEGAMSMWWTLLESYSIEQVERALRTCIKSADSGQFMPKPADVIRALEGTTSDRSQIAWGKVLGAMSQVGAYQHLAFDDPAIHAAIEDFGGWVKLCRTETKELSYAQHRFCGSHKAYVAKGEFDYPRVLLGERDPDAAYTAKGLPVPKPVLVGNEAACLSVMRGGSASGKGAITFNSRLLNLASNSSDLKRVA